MSKFVLTAQLQLQAPTNTRSVINQLRSQLQGQLNIPVNVTGSVQAAKQIKQVTQQTQQATTAAHNMGKAFGASIKRFAAFNIATRAVGLLASKLASAVDEAIAFQRQLIKISQVTGKTTGELSDLVKEVTRLSTVLGVSSTSLLDTTRILAQAGIQAGDLKVALAALAKTTLAPTFDNITQTAEGAVAILAQFEKGVGSLEQQLGSINAIAGQFAVESGDLISVIRRAGGVFKQAGGSLNELLALFTSVRATTRENAESIATGLRTIFTRIQRPQTIEYLKQFGVELLDLEGKFVGPYKAVEQLSIALSGLEEGDIRFVEIAEQLGGFRQIGKVIPLIQQFSLAERARQAALEGGNSLNKDAAIAQQALAVQIEKTREKFLALIRSISETSTFRIMIQSLLGIAEAFLKVAEAIKPIIPLIAAFGAFKLAKGIGGFASGLGAGVRGKNQGGKIHAFASGGSVPGSGNRDTVPAILTPGEFVIRKSSVSKIGAGTLASMNENGYAAGGAVTSDRHGYGIRAPGTVLPPAFANNSAAMTSAKRKFKNTFGESDASWKALSPDDKQKKAGMMASEPKAVGVSQGSEQLQRKMISGAKLSTKFGASFLRDQPQPTKLEATIRGVKNAANATGKKALNTAVVAAVRRKNPKDTKAGKIKSVEQAYEYVDRKAVITTPSGVPTYLQGKGKKIFADEIDAGIPKMFTSAVKAFKGTELDPALAEPVKLKNLVSTSAKGAIEGQFFEAFVRRITGNVIKDDKIGGPDPIFDFQTLNSPDLKTLFGQQRFEKPNEFKNVASDPNIASVIGKALTLDTKPTFFASGGGISGSDTVPAMLTPGEFVVNKKASQSIGYGNLNKMNKQGVVGYANGGAVEVQKFANGGKTNMPEVLSASKMHQTQSEKLAKQWNKRAAQLKKMGVQDDEIVVQKEKFLESLRKENTSKKRGDAMVKDEGRKVDDPSRVGRAFKVSDDKLTVQKQGQVTKGEMERAGQGKTAGGVSRKANKKGAQELGKQYNAISRKLRAAGATEDQLSKVKTQFLQEVKKQVTSGKKSVKTSTFLDNAKKELAKANKAAAAKAGSGAPGGGKGGGKGGGGGGEGGGVGSFTTIFALQAALALVGPALTDLAKEVGEDGELIATGTSEVIDNLLEFTTALIAAGFVISQFTGVQAFFTGSMAFAGKATTGFAFKAQAAGNALGPLTVVIGGAYLAIGLLISSIEKYRQLQQKLNEAIEKGDVGKAGEAGEDLSVSNTGAKLAKMGGVAAVVAAVFAALAVKGFMVAAATGVVVTGMGALSLGITALAAASVAAKIGLGIMAGGLGLAVTALLYFIYTLYGKDEAAKQRAQADALLIKNQNLAALAAENAATELEKIKGFEKTAQSALLGNEGKGSPTVQQALKNSGLESAQGKVRAADTQRRQAQDSMDRQEGSVGADTASVGLAGGAVAATLTGNVPALVGILGLATIQFFTLRSVVKEFEEAEKESTKATLARTTAEVKFLKAVQDTGLIRKGFNEELNMGGDFETWLDKQEAVGTKGSKDSTPETIAMWNAMMNQGTNELRKQFEAQKVEYDILLKKLGALNLGLGGVIGSIKGISLSMNNSLKSLDKDFSGFAAAASTFAASMTDAAMGLDPAEVDAARETFLQQLSGAGADKKQINEVRQKSQGVEFLQRNQEQLLTDFKEAKKTDPTKTDKDILKDQLKSKLTTVKAAGGAGIDPKIAEDLIANISGKALNDAVSKMGEGDFAGALALILKESTDRLNKDTKAAAEALVSINKDLVDSTRRRVAVEDQYIAARKRTIAAELEAAKIREEFGGREVTYNDKLKNLNKSLDAQLTRGGRVGGNAASPGGVSARELLNVSNGRNTQQQNINQNRLNNARDTGQARTGTFREAQGDELLQRSQQDQQALVDYSRQRIDLIREEIQIQKEKNKLEKSSLDALLSGDIEGFFKQQAAVGAQAALKSGNQGLVSNFGATAVGAGFQDLAGQKGVDAATKRRAAGMALNQFGITDQGAADVLAEQTPEIRGLEAEARQFADVIQMASKALEGFAKSDLDITTEIVNIVQRRAPQGVKNATPTGTNSVNPNTGQRFRQRNTPRNVAAQNNKDRLDAQRNQSGNSMGFNINPLSKGGPVYANRGMFIPRGTDTVPAMLTPGEFVVNRASVQRGNNLALLKSMNNNQQAPGPAMAQGGQVQYRQFGGIMDAIGKTFDAALPNLQNVFSGFTSAVEKLTGMQIGVKLDASTVTVNIASNVLERLPELIQNHVYKELARQLPKIQHSPNGGHKLDSVG